MTSCDVILDAIFGFSFSGGSPRSPFDVILQDLAKKEEGIPTPAIVSVDIPSGWDVEMGPPTGEGSLRPDMLVSLTAPKLCAKHFEVSKHFQSLRFLLT